MTVVPLVGKQTESIRLATARGNLWEGAVRSSKTVCSILRWLQFVRQGPPGPLMMIGKTERTLKRNIIDPIVEMVGKSRCRYRAGAGELELFGRLIYTAGANDERAAEKLKGLTLAGAYCDEVTTFPQTAFAMLLTRLSVEGAAWFGTTNPAGSNHWLMRDYLSRARLHLTRDGETLRSNGDDRLNLHRFSFKLEDNPTLPAEYVAQVKAENVGLFYRRNVLGEWVLAEGAVFSMWDEARHVVDDLPPILRWLCAALDYGTTNPFHAGMLGVGEDRRLYLTREWRWDARREHRQLSDVEYSQRLREWMATVPRPGETRRGVDPEYVIVDPSAASFRVQLRRDGVTARLGNNSVLDGIRTVSSLLALDLLRVHSSCIELAREMPGYSWDDKASARGEDAPLKVDDHGPDMLRYGVHTTRSAWRPMLPASLPIAA
ncbi:PBSX family phage terminase large subunit [Actinomadura decatromicini]|uniref:PBSX family phage terminase large subunit n=1 Tax=Actinomadura decatromicini TaxID=2604572 RepID=A0A5D3FIP4_9ACTN|nr:phage terminase large subunit [Actinomadura decatromicini]TYK47165.1 PBSX family phage terminase large subunit [Actinomadura decatromicini]